MKKIFNKLKSNILLFDFVFVVVNIIINFVLYLFNVRFRLWVIVFIILISLIGFVVGFFQQAYKLSKNRKKVIIFSLIVLVFIVSLFLLFLPFLSFAAVFSYRPQHIVILDNNKYVAVVNSYLYVDVDYYDYYGPLLMGTKVRVHGYFGKGGFNPFTNPNVAESVEYTYYDNNGKIKAKKNVFFIKDTNGDIVEENSYDVYIDLENEYNANDDYLLPEEIEILYEERFGKTILRFGKIDDVIGNRFLVNVLKSSDNGKNFYLVSDDAIEVANDAKFVFFNEQLGFAISNWKIYLNSNRAGLYVTNNGGKNFSISSFEYVNSNVEYITIKDVPYLENNILKIKCSVYQVNLNKDGYEEKELIFVSVDNGLNWKIEE